MVALYLALGYSPKEIDDKANAADMDAEMRDGACSW